MSDEIPDEEKIKYLFYKSQNLASTDLKPNINNNIFLENKNYVLSEYVLSNAIPEINHIIMNEGNSNITDKYKLLTNNDLHSNSGTSLLKDASSIVLKVTQLKLQKIPYSENSWYYLDSTKNNFLTPMIPPNYKSSNNGTNNPYQIEIYSKKGLDRVSANNSILANELLRSCDYIFDYQNGILMLKKDCSDSHGDIFNEDNPPYITFFKYTGATGVGSGTISGTSSGTSSGTGSGGQWTKNSNNNIYYNNGSVLIGTNQKSSSLTQIDLEVSGNVYISGDLEVSGNVIKIDELHVYGDISANTAEFDKVDICGNLTTKNLIVNGNTVLKDISGADASFNNIYGEIKTPIQNLITKMDGLISIGSNGGGPTVFASDISGTDASFNNINITGNIYKDGELFSSGSGIEISGNEIDVSLTSNESKIFYDASRNLFIGGVRQYADHPSRDTNPVIIEPLGYSFFRENMEGQPPAPSFFFFSITPSSIQINWSNPKQYISGVSNTNDPYNHAANGELAATVNSNGNIYFPVVNRIMIQIKDKADNSYKYWGTKTSPISSGISGLEHGRVICSKNYPIPPIKTGITPEFSGSTRIDNGRDNKIYELNDFANSIILYSTGSTPENNNLSIDGNNKKRISGNKSDSNSTELANSNSGYEIKLWLENQYNSGSMTESDFNVVTLNDTGDGVTPINFSAAEAPSTDATLNAIIKFNDLSTANNGVQNGKTYVELELKDPSRSANDKPDLNSSINLTGIQFEIAYYDDNERPQFNLVSDFYFKDTTTISTNSDLPSNPLSDDFHQINRLRDNDTRYYYVPLDNTKSKKNIQFRIYYKNATNPDFRLQSETSTIVVNKPNKPIISKIKMSSSDQIEISIAKMTPNNKISNTSVNNNNGVFLRTIDLIAKYESDNGDIEEYPAQITSVGVDDKNYYHSNTQHQTTTYIFDLPSGEDVSALSSLKWAFQVRVKNNLINEWSEISDTAISNNNIDKTKNNAIEIIGVSISNQVTDFKFVQGERTNISNAEMDLRWENPAAGDRGVGKSNLNNENNQIPTIYDYQYSVFRPDVSQDNRIIIDASNIQINRNTDAYDQGTNLPFIFDIFDKNGNKNNSSGSGNTDGEEREIKTIISQRNEYVTSQTQITGSLYYKLSPPGLVNITSNTPYVTPDTNDINNLKLLWDKPNETGLQIKELADKTVKDYVEIPLGIKQYDIDITAKRTTSKSPYYYLQGNDTAATNDVSISGIQIKFTRDQYGGFIDAIGSLSGNSNGIINKNTVKWSGSTGDTIANLLVFPDTEYIFNIKTTNVFSLQGDAKRIVTDTLEPDSLLKQFNTIDKKIPINSTYGDININNNGGLLYAENGFLLESNEDTKPTTITLYEITKAINFPSFSANDTHRINKNKFNDFLVDNDTNKIPNEYVNSPNQLKDKKLRQFRIKNNANYIYVFGSNSSFNSITDSTGGTALHDMLTITSTEVSDEFAGGSGKDTNNRGYWWKENIKYIITIDSSKETLYKNPVKLSLETRYNNQLSTKAEWDTSSLGTGNHVDTVERVIFQNSKNPSGHIYFDKLSGLPQIQKIDTNTDMLTYTTNNKINGIPNLYMLSNDKSFTMTLKYKLINFSQYYGLDPNVNFVEHILRSNQVNSDVNILGIEIRNWNSKNDCTRTANGWTISGLTITNGSATSVPNTNVGSSNQSKSHADVRLLFYTKNLTSGYNEQSLDINHSTVWRFIYDKNSVDEYNNISSSLFEIPSSFDPELGNSTGRSSTIPSSYAAIGEDTNDLQMSMYDGYFYSNAGWQNITGIIAGNSAFSYGLLDTLPVFDTNNSNYRYSIFKYSKTFTDALLIDRVMCSLQGENSDSTYEIKISDLNNGGIEVYMYLIIDGTAYFIKDQNQISYYWLNISKSGGGITFTDSAFKNIIYSGGLADTGYQSDNQGMSNDSFISGSDTDINSITYSSKGFTTTGAFSGSFPRRLIGSYINQATIEADKKVDVYIAIKCRNDIQRRFKKPKLYLANGDTQSKTFEML